MIIKTLPRYAFVCLFLLIFSACNSDKKEEGYLAIPDPKTLGETFITNTDGLLNNETVSTLNQTLQALDQSGKAHIDVVVVKSIGDAVPKDAATTLFRKWKIGDKETNNGLLILIVNDQHRIEFETGYGLEGDLPDIVCYRIQQQYMIPHAKANDLDRAVREGVAAVIRQLSTGNAQLADSTATDTATSGAVAITDSTMQDIDLPSGALETTSLVNNNYQERELLDGFTIAIGIVFLILTGIIDFLLYGYRIKRRLASLMFWLTFLLPIIVALCLNWFYPVSWFNGRTALVFYIAISIYLSFHFLIVGSKLGVQLKGKDRYEQYVARNQRHYNMVWSVFIFPLPLLAVYWVIYHRIMYKLRNTPYACKACGTAMQKLSETDDDKYIQHGQKIEERVKSADYDVWTCHDESHEKLIYVYKNLGSSAKECPKCHYLTLMPDGKEVVSAATASSEGWGWKLKRCHNCDRREKERYTIPKVSSSSSSSGGGSSSGSSFSSSSGGSSGGGGAGSSW
ncbi:hypothetical protein GCM10023149_13570 [Mucilaginibacter gynuensis]|uniref:TPM domain-containing protein n=1 Tax=Mucilaginibacter gynuensis TaxID=1302236 RepID=A0ABP8G3Y8_9SPHI